MTDPEYKVMACNVLLSRYTLEFYKMEARVQDYVKCLKRFDNDNVNYDSRFLKLRQRIFLDENKSNHFKLLEISRNWWYKRRRDFFEEYDCLTTFDSPEYDRITSSVIKEAIKYYEYAREDDEEIERQLDLSEMCSDNGSSTQIYWDSLPQVICTTDKYHKAFKNWNIWIKSQLLRVTINSHWKTTGVERTFQSFKFPMKNKKLDITKQEKEFRADNGLCPYCGNHKLNDGNPCESHPMYNDAMLDNDKVLNVDINTLVKSKRLEVVEVNWNTITPVKREPATNSRTSPSNKKLPEWKRRLLIRSLRKQRRATATVGIFTPKLNWITIETGIGTCNEISHVTTAFIKRYKLAEFVTETENPIEIRRHSVSPDVIVTQEVLWLRLRVGKKVTLVMACVLQDPDCEELLLGNDWLHRYQVNFRYNRYIGFMLS